MPDETMKIIRLPASPTLEALNVSREAVPQPGSGEVLMRVHATSLNFHDFLVIAGHIPQPAGRVPMSDGAGVIAALGADVTGWAVGDRVMGAFFPDWIDGPPTDATNGSVAGESIDGFAAEYVVVPAHSLCAMPDGWSFEEAATVPCAGLTAWRVLVIEGELQAGDRVLLPGSGGLSVFAIQLAKALGIETIVTSSSDEKLARLAKLGANHGINYRQTPEWGEAVRTLTGGVGVDVVLEIGGDSSMEQSAIACRTGGRIAMVGTTAHAPPVIPFVHVIMRHLRIQGLAVGSVSQLRTVTAFLAQHDIRPIIDRTFTLEELTEAFKYQLSGQHLGKICVTI